MGLGGSPTGGHVGVMVFLSVILSVTVLVLIEHNVLFKFTIPMSVLSVGLFYLSWYLVSSGAMRVMLGTSSAMYKTFLLLNGEMGAQFYLTTLLTTVMAAMTHVVMTMRGVVRPDFLRIIKERVKQRVHDVIVMPSKTGDGASVVVPHKRNVARESLL